MPSRARRTAVAPVPPPRSSAHNEGLACRGRKSCRLAKARSERSRPSGVSRYAAYLGAALWKRSPSGLAFIFLRPSDSFDSSEVVLLTRRRRAHALVRSAPSSRQRESHHPRELSLRLLAPSLPSKRTASTMSFISTIFPIGLKRPTRVPGIIFVQWSVHDAGGCSVEADTVFCVFDCETSGYCIQASLS